MNTSTRESVRATTPRRDFLRQAALLAAAGWGAGRVQAAAGGASSGGPLFISATKLAAAIRRGEWTAREVVERHIARILEVEPIINALGATCFTRARFEADRADEALAAGKAVGPLHGVPMTIKDSFDTEGVVSTAGTLGRKDFIPGEDATVVARVRQAGAILLGKSNTPEFTLGVGMKGTDNLVYGMTRNPYNLAYQPGASSGGAAAIVAAGGAAFDLGSDIYGSIRDPAYSCGVVGLKPTHGRVSRVGHIIGYGGAFDSFQGVGPIVRHAEDLALLLPIIAGPDGRDAALQPVPLGAPADVDLPTLRVAFYASNGYNPPSAEIQLLVRRCADGLRDLGCEVSEDLPPLMPELAEARGALSKSTGGYLTQSLLTRWGTTEPYPATVHPAESGSADELTRAAEALDAARSEQLAWFQSYDLILCPASVGPARPNDREAPPPPPPPPGVKPRYPYYLGIYNTNGWPAGVVRAGTSAEVPGLPLGVQVVGRPWREDQVIAALTFLESFTGGYEPPSL